METVTINHNYRHFRMSFRLNQQFHWFCTDVAGTDNVLYRANAVVQ